MIAWNDRRKAKKAQSTEMRKNISAMAEAGTLRAAPKHEMVPMHEVSKGATRFFGGTTYKSSKPKMVAKGSKKEARLQKKEQWAKVYEEKQDRKFDTQQARAKAERAAKEAKGMK